MSKPDFLYELLPTIYRQTDIPHGMPLRALFTILQEQHDLLESDIAALNDNWFVETCEAWVLPYLADLLGVDHVRHDVNGVNSRRLIANTIAYRRRKGVAATLEHVAEDATGWSARVVEGADLVAMTETGRRSGARRRGTVSMRDAVSLDLLGSPFENCCRSAAVRIDQLSNLDRIGLFLWRLQSYPMRLVEAAAVGGGSGRFTFDPLGRDMRLFNRRLRSGGIERRNGLRNVPAPLSRRLLADELARSAATRPTDDDFLRGTAPAFAIYLAGSPQREMLSASDFIIGDLSHWRLPATTTGARVVVDPERGRLMLLREQDRREGRVLTDHCYGFAGDIGGGPYFQPATPLMTGPPAWRARVSRIQTFVNVSNGTDTDAVRHYPSLREALDAWTDSNAASEQDAVIEIADSGTYRVDDNEGSRPALDLRLDVRRRSLTIQAAPQHRPCIVGSLSIRASRANAEVKLDGLIVDGTIHVRGALTLMLRHCTVVPTRGNISILADPDTGDGLRVTLQSAITAGLRLPPRTHELNISDSIIDARDLCAIAAPEAFKHGDHAKPDRGGANGGDLSRPHAGGPPTIIARSTLVGTVVAAEIRASDSIFTAPLTVERRHEGFVRYCFLTAGSRTPQRYECLSDASPAAHSNDDAIKEALIRPRFSSLTIGHPGYAQLAVACPREILVAASNSAELGAFNHMDDARRRDNLRDMLDEHLPVGCRPVTVYVT